MRWPSSSDWVWPRVPARLEEPRDDPQRRSTRTAGEQRYGAGTMIGAVGAIDARGTTEFGRDHDYSIAPALAQAVLEFRQRTVDGATHA